MQSRTLPNMFGSVIPFCFLPRDIRDDLETVVTQHRLESDVTFVRQGDTEDQRIFLLLKGRVETFDETSGVRVAQIEAGHYFGERAALFDEVRRVAVRTLERSEILSIPGERFLRLFAQSPVFAQGMANILRHKQGVFTNFERFIAELNRALGSGVVLLPKLLPLYQELLPALHTGAKQDTLDLSALSYAVRRLPANVTRCFAYYVTEVLLDHQSKPNEHFLQIPTAARRRVVYELLPGKNMVLIRDGSSDVVDFITCLCLFAIEARKIRRRLLYLDALRALTDRDESFQLPFTEEEMADIRRVWPEDTLGRLRELVLHHEDIQIIVVRHLDNYNSAHAEGWTNQIAALTQSIFGVEPALLRDDLDVHVISSNTHSVSNCLSPWLHAHADEILAWAKEQNHPLVARRWFNDTDCMYALAREFLRDHPDLAEEKAKVDRAAGICVLRETAFTGIEVQLIDTHRLFDAGEVDPAVDRRPCGLIINIDYAFGQQAEHIIANLLYLFGRRVKSINVLGKAGALRGKRGDILAATAFIEQTHDVFQPIPANCVDLERLRRSTDRDVHVGPVLTVAGTLLQDKRMLLFNKHVWGCTGLEMEGFFYLGPIIEAMNRGILARNVALRFLYYVSDLPLNHTENLRAALLAIEGIPPLYAVTREVLHGIASQR